VFENLGHKQGEFSVAEKVANQCLSLPMSPYLSHDDQTRVIEVILGHQKP
jgi:UDP-2-acetamido-2-deoxy-ribo-hexuluronate aminotransferase